MRSHAGRNFRKFIFLDYGFYSQISKSNKSAVWNKGVQVGKFLKFHKVCCTTIRETKVKDFFTKLLSIQN